MMAVQWRFFIYIISIQVFIPLSLTVARVKRDTKKMPVEPQISDNSRKVQRIAAPATKNRKAPIVRGKINTPESSVPITGDIAQINSCCPNKKNTGRPVMPTDLMSPKRNKQILMSNNQNKPMIIIPSTSQNGKQFTDTVLSTATTAEYKNDSEQLFEIISNLNANNSSTIQMNHSNESSNVDIDTNILTNDTTTRPEIQYSCNEFTIIMVEPITRPKNSTIFHKINKKSYRPQHDL